MDGHHAHKQVVAACMNAQQELPISTNVKNKCTLTHMNAKQVHKVNKIALLLLYEQA